MYSETVTARRRHAYELSHPGLRLRSVPVDRAREITLYLEGKPNVRGETVRPPLTAELAAFIENERAMCKASFLYFAERYCFIDYRTGAGVVDLFRAFESQLLLIRRLGRDEEHMWERRDLGDRSFDGLLYLIHKSRQLGFTTLCQLLLLHRSLFYADFKTLTASLNDQKTQDAHAIWNLAYSRLPWWLQTRIEARGKERGKWLANGSYVALQDFSQASGLGQGGTWSGFHLTEVASVPDDYLIQQLENHFFNAVPMSFRAMGFLESTAQGRDNWWHKKFLRAWSHTFDRWGGIFIPWYAEPSTYSSPDIPLDWQPADDTVAHAEKVARTSPEYMEGRTIHLSRAQLYWWERKRDSAKADGALAVFYSNFCATIDESFQFVAHSAFNSERIILLQDRVNTTPIAYELLLDPSDRKRLTEAGKINTAPDAPLSYSVGAYDLVPIVTTERDENDPRGIVMLFERPRRDVVYSIGVDTANGIVGWRRDWRTDDDAETRLDNSVASVWYHDKKTGQARQAAEIAGPIAPREFAPYVYALGKLFTGLNAPSEGAPLIIEVYPAASGAQVQQQLQYEMGYYNFFQWAVFNGMEVKETNSWGWVSSARSVPQLWSKAKDMIEALTMPVRPQSRLLFSEMSACRWDNQRQRGMALNGHDDRVSAMLMALWQLYNWANPHAIAAPAPVKVLKPGEIDPSKIDYQQRDITSAQYSDAIDEMWERMSVGSR